MTAFEVSVHVSDGFCNPFGKIIQVLQSPEGAVFRHDSLCFTFRRYNSELATNAKKNGHTGGAVILYC